MNKNKIKQLQMVNVLGKEESVEQYLLMLLYKIADSEITTSENIKELTIEILDTFGIKDKYKNILEEDNLFEIISKSVVNNDLVAQLIYKLRYQMKIMNKIDCAIDEVNKEKKKVVKEATRIVEEQSKQLKEYANKIDVLITSENKLKNELNNVKRKHDKNTRVLEHKILYLENELKKHTKNSDEK